MAAARAREEAEAAAREAAEKAAAKAKEEAEKAARLAAKTAAAEAEARIKAAEERATAAAAGRAAAEHAAHETRPVRRGPSPQRTHPALPALESLLRRVEHRRDELMTESVA
jgi:translation initiation factor IF-2